MENMKKILFVLVLFFFSLDISYAECDFTENNKLNSLAVNVKASYEVSYIEQEKDEFFNAPDGMTPEEIEDFKSYKGVFNIKITNLTKELYITVYDKMSKETKTYTYNDSENGIITIIQEDMLSMNTYSITVYSSEETNCPDKKLYTLSLTTPYYNELSSYSLCDDIKEFYLCHEFLTVESTSFEDFSRLVESYKKGKIDDEGKDVKKEEEKTNNFFDFIKEHKVLIISISSGILVGGIVITIIVVKKQRRKKNENFY